jgi:hypothetical protein
MAIVDGFLCPVTCVTALGCGLRAGLCLCRRRDVCGAIRVPSISGALLQRNLFGIAGGAGRAARCMARRSA